MIMDVFAYTYSMLQEMDTEWENISCMKLFCVTLCYIRILIYIIRRKCTQMKTTVDSNEIKTQQSKRKKMDILAKDRNNVKCRMRLGDRHTAMHIVARRIHNHNNLGQSISTFIG